MTDYPVIDLIKFVEDGKPLEFEKTFNDLLKNKIADRIEDKKINVADVLFNGINKEKFEASQNNLDNDDENLDYSEDEETEGDDEKND